MMRERFDHIEIIDLRGDARRGERAGVDADQGVFKIMVGTAITLAIADGSKAEGKAAEVHYQDSWREGLFPRGAKLAWLLERAENGMLSDPVVVERDLLDDMRPKPFENETLVSLVDCFNFKSSGVETTRDELAYDVTGERLANKIQTFLRLPPDEAARAFYSQSRKAAFAVARALPFEATKICAAGYRPLDRRALYNQRGYVDWPRPKLQAVWGHSNVAIMAMPNGTAGGPGCWCHALLPDRHAFRGSYGGYAFPFYDRRPGQGPINLKAELIEALNAAHGATVGPQEVFDAILCLLSAQSYTLRFAEDLEDVFPHVCPSPQARRPFGELPRWDVKSGLSKPSSDRPAKPIGRRRSCA